MSVHLRDPLTENSTFVTLTLSEAEAVMVIVVFRGIVEPLVGLVIATTGWIVSMTGVGVGIGVGVDVGVAVGRGVGVGVGVVSFDTILPTWLVDRFPGTS